MRPLPFLGVIKTLEHRPYQNSLRGRSMDAYDEGFDSVLIESPTGSGKTVIGLSIARDIQKGAPDVAVVWAAHRRNLLANAINDNALVGVRNLIPVSLFDRNIEEKLVGFERIILVLDEAHHSAADSCVSLWSKVCPIFTIGLTATPMRADDMKLCFQKNLREAGYARLINDGYLSQYHQYLLPSYSPESVAQTFLVERDRWGKTAMYFHTFEECLRCEAHLKSAGVACAIVTGTTDREQQIEDFDAGKLSVLINMLVLTEGWDCPDLQTVFVRDSNQGTTMQIAGRVLRKHPSLPVKNIVQSVQSDWNFAKTALPAVAFVQQGSGTWLSCTPNSKLLESEIARADAELGHLDLVHGIGKDSPLGRLHNRTSRRKRAREHDKHAAGEDAAEAA